MFFNIQKNDNKLRYEKLLKIVCSLSKLNSQSNSPYLHYRMAENIFCEVFNADNLSRNDISIDAKKENVGIGLKTFLHKNGKSMEKIAEFNKDLELFNNKKDKETCKIVSTLRNKRLDFACRSANVSEKSLLYHCITRDENILFLHEEQMQKIDVTNIQTVKKSKNVIHFNDGKSEYGFHISKSTLFKRFITEPIYSIDVDIIQDPYKFLEELLYEKIDIDINPIIQSVILPLYSPNLRKVPMKSGLNQWNANGRKRDKNEIYIPIPSVIHHKFPNFFPNRDDSFSLVLPNGSSLSVKVCQDGGKALMSNPNLALGKWLLRDVLNIKEGKIITYDILKNSGIDSVQINKYKDNTYEINFKQIGSYDKFVQDYQL